MENNKNKDVTEYISSIINSIIEKVFTSIEEIDISNNPEKADADIKFNTLNLDEIISQVNNSINIFSSFDNILLSNNSILNSEENENKKEPIKINNIEELLLNEEQITEIIYTYDKRYKDCFNENNMIKLIDYSTHMAYISDDEIMTHKYPFYACELLRCDAPYIYENFFNNEKIMAYFFEFLNDEKNRSNNVLSGYFTKIFLSLLDKKNDAIINYIFKEENLYIEEIIELCEDSSFCECVKNLLILSSNKDNYDEKKLFILKKLNMKLFRNEEYTNKICFEIYSSLLEEGNLIFCNFFLRNFEKIFENYDYGYKNKKINFELFGYYIHLVRVIKECFTREKENNVDIDVTQMTRKSLNSYVIQNRQIFLDFELNLLDSTTSILFIRNSTEENIEKITYRRILVAYLDILVYIIFTASIKYKDEKNQKKDFNYYINKIQDIFTPNILLKITNVIFKYPLFNMLQVSYINLISTLCKIKSPLINNDLIINNCIDYIIHENTEKDILISFLVKVLYIIYHSLKEQNLLFNKKLKYAYEIFIKNINDIFEAKLLFNQPYYGNYSSDKKSSINDINNKIDEIDEINNNKDIKDIKSNNDIKNINEIISIKGIKNIDNNESYNDINNHSNNNGYVFKDVVNKGIYDYINKIRFCNSSKNLTSVDNISEEIDLDDFNDEDIDDNNNKNHKPFTLTTFDEIDDEESNNNESIGEIFKQTVNIIKSIKLRNKINEENKNKDLFEKNILNNIVIKSKKEEEKDKDINNNNEKPKIAKSKTMNKFKSRSKPNFLVNININNNYKSYNSLPLIINNNKNNENDNFKTKKIIINSIKSNNNNNKNDININTKIDKFFDINNNNICNKDNNINIKILPNIKKNSDEKNHGRYFYYDMNDNNNKKPIIKNNSNLYDKINNFRSNNIIKIKDKKENNNLFNLKKSSDNMSNYKCCLTLFNKDKNQISQVYDNNTKRLNEI